MPSSIFDRLTELLEGHGVPFEIMEHEPVYTSEQAARVRGTPLASGAKALLCKADAEFLLIVVPAHLRLDSKRVRRDRAIRSFRFASKQEVEQLTGLAPGAIPPFGSLFGVATWCDQGLAQQPQINFNAGSHDKSISMSLADYVKVERPQMGDFAELEK